MIRYFEQMTQSAKRNHQIFLVESIREQISLGRTLEEAAIKLRVAFSQDEIDSAIKIFLDHYSQLLRHEESLALKENKSFQDWYTGPRTDSG